MKHHCPHCGKAINPAALMGAAGRGKSKARTPEQARKAAQARWAKAKKQP